MCKIGSMGIQHFSRMCERSAEMNDHCMCSGMCIAKIMTGLANGE